MAAVLVHIDLDGARPHASSLQALAAGRAVASSWGATLYAAVLVHDPGKRAGDTAQAGLRAARVPGEAKAIEAVRSALARGGADKIAVVKTAAAVLPLWSAVGEAWQGVLDKLRPRLVLFGADAPSAAELGPRTAARIGARLLLRARALGIEDVELRDRDFGHVRAEDSGAAVALIGAAPRLGPHGEDDIDVMVLAMPGGPDPRVELVSTARAELAHATGALIAIGDDAASEPAIARATQQLAELLDAHVVGSAAAASAGVVAAGAVIERTAPLAPELCVLVGAPAVDLAGSTHVIRIGPGSDKEVGGALPGPIGEQLTELVRALERR